MIRTFLPFLMVALASAARSEPDSAPKDTVAQIWGLTWHSTLRGTIDAATETKAAHVLWLRLLGDLAGKA